MSPAGARRRRRWLVATLVAGTAGVAATALVVVSKPPPAASRAAEASVLAEAAELPDPVRPAFTPPKPKLLNSSLHVSHWAPVRVAAVARRAPTTDAPAVARLETQTPEGTTNIVVALRSRSDERGRVWVLVRLAALPNNTAGWVPRRALGGYIAVRTRLVVDLDALTATLYRDGRPVFRAAVGVGKPSWPTPRGEFYIRNKLTDFDDPVYGPLAFGTSARSPVLTDWPAGGFVGIHGTNEPHLLPGRVSHGCIRLRNEDILRLAKVMPVGTPLSIV